MAREGVADHRVVVAPLVDQVHDHVAVADVDDLPGQFIDVVVVALSYILGGRALVGRGSMTMTPRIAGARDDGLARVLEPIFAALVYKNPLRLLAGFGFEAHGRARKR